MSADVGSSTCCGCGGGLTGETAIRRHFPKDRKLKASSDAHALLRDLLDGVTKDLSFFLRLKSVTGQLVCDSCHDEFRRRCRRALQQKLVQQVVTYTVLAALIVFGVSHEAITRAPLRDTAIVVGAYVTALAYLWIAYEKGGRVWIIRHAMITDTVRCAEEAMEDVSGLLAILTPFTNPSGVQKPASAGEAAKTIWLRLLDARGIFFRASSQRPFQSWVFRYHLIVVSRPAPDYDEVRVPSGAYLDRRPRTWRRCVSGFFGEAVILSAAASICVLIVWQCASANIIGVLKTWPRIFGALAVFVALVVADYSVKQVQKASLAKRSRSYRGALADAYFAYGVYSWVLFAFGALVIGLITFEFMSFQQVFDQQKVQILSTLAVADRIGHAASKMTGSSMVVGYKHTLSVIESAYGQLAAVNITLQAQINPVLLFAALLILINIVITHTGFKHLFADEGRTYTSVFTYGPLLLVAAAAGYVYFNSYRNLIQSMIIHLDSVMPAGGVVEAETIKRMAELTTELKRDSNVFGFAAAIGGAGSGAPLFLAGLKEVLDRMNATEAMEEAGDELLRRPDPRFRPTSRSPKRILKELMKDRRNELAKRSVVGPKPPAEMEHPG